jgi:AraC-like DNA-binding protein
MAQVIDMSSYYFCRFFKSLSGKTPFEYLNAYRINMAALWLRQTDSKVTEIAYDAGFPISVILSNCSERQRAVRQRLSVLNVDCFVTTSLP